MDHPTDLNVNQVQIIHRLYKEKKIPKDFMKKLIQVHFSRNITTQEVLQLDNYLYINAIIQRIFPLDIANVVMRFISPTNQVKSR